MGRIGWVEALSFHDQDGNRAGAVLTQPLPEESTNTHEQKIEHDHAPEEQQRNHKQGAAALGS